MNMKWRKDDSMKKRRLGNSDLAISEISLGCMSLGTDIKQAKHIVDQAIDNGINYFDTADLYDNGKNEALLGEILKHKRKDILLATKVGNHLKDDGTWYWDPSKKYIKEQVKNSLRRLQTDYIDLYQLHGGTIEDNFDETIEAFEELVNEGLIRYYGISSIRPNVINYYRKHSTIISNMMQYSLFDRRPEELFQHFKENNISVVTRGTLAKGLLSKDGKTLIDQKAKDGYLTYDSNEVNHTILQLEHILEENQTLTGLALAYVLQEEAVSSTVLGASSPEQLKENIQAYEQHFSKEQLTEAASITKQSIYTQHRE